MANGKPPQLAIAVASGPAAPEPDNDCSEGSNTHGGSTGEHGMVTEDTRQVSSLPCSHESRVTDEFELLWRLRKYLVLLGILAVGVTYNAGLTPPGGFWSENTNGRDAHRAGDSVLRARFFPRHEVFFYCNATAFAASLVLIILLLSKHVARQKLWLRSMQLTMILDLFSLMGAFAAGSCRALKSSIYIWVLVFAVFIYIVIHILVSIKVVPQIILMIKGVAPKWLKKKVKFLLLWVQSKCVNVRKGSSYHENNLEITENEDNDLEEARKFILMLVTFAATVTYQAGLSVPGGFWAENKRNKIPATSMLRSKNLARYNTFVICNSTSFVASLVTVILLLSPELSRHGIRSKAVIVCVVVDLLGLIGAYAAGSSRSVPTSVFVILITVVVWICFAILYGTFVHQPVADWLEEIKPDIKKCMRTIGRVFSFKSHRNRSRNREGDGSVASCQKTACRETDSMKTESTSGPEHQLESHHLVPNIKEDESLGEHQTAGKQQTANTEEVVSGSEESLMNDEQSENGTEVMYNLEGQSTDSKSPAKQPTSRTETLPLANTREQSPLADDLETTNPAAKETTSTRENMLLVNTREQSLSMDDLKTKNPTDGLSNSEYQSADSEQVANSDPRFSIMPVVDISKDIMLENDCNGATSDKKAIKSEIVEINGDARNPVNGNIGKNEGPFKQDDNNENDGGNRTDKHLKKSRTYLLLLAILAVSLTYQSGLNPPGGFWSKKGDNNSTGDRNLKDNHHRPYHLPGDPILEDTHHRRYIAFFYLNAIAFVASLVMIIMLLSRRMSSKVIKRYALQGTMIVDLLALTWSYIMGSCREAKNSMYISLLVFLVLAYVAVHVMIAMHIIPEGCKEAVADKLDNFCRCISFGYNKRGDANGRDCELGHNQRDDSNEKDWERRRNLLLMLAVLAATVTYQAGMNPPGGVWSDDPEVGGNPGDPILQHNHNNLKRYDVFYYSNSISFVSSVVITILLVNKESCEHGIKFYALRVCLMVGLVGLLIAYSAGSCRKPTQSIYHIIIAVAVLISLVIQVFLLSSTEGTPQGPTRKFVVCLLKLLSDKEASQETTSKQKESHGHPKEKGDKRHKYLMLLAILAASITYQAGLNPPGGIWSDDDDEGHVAGNPILLDIHPGRYKIFFWCNSISLMASIVVIMFLLNRSVRKKDVPLWVLHIIMVLDLLALMTAFAAGSCRKFRTSVYVYALVLGVVIYLVIAIFVSSGIANYLKSKERSGHSSQRNRICASGTNAPKPGEQA